MTRKLREIKELTAVEICELIYECISGEWPIEDICKSHGCTSEHWLEWRERYVEGALKSIIAFKEKMEIKAGKHTNN